MRLDRVLRLLGSGHPGPLADQAFELRVRAWFELPPGRARVARALLEGGLEFSGRPFTYQRLADDLGIELVTFREHLRRIKRLDPEFHAAMMSVRRARLDAWHVQVAGRRRERSRRWGKQEWARAYRARNGEWPWTALARGDSTP